MTSTTQSPTSDDPSSTQPVTTLLGKGSEFEGKLSFEGTVRVDGKLTGEIFTDDVLIVGEGAEVNAEVTVGSIVIQGVIRGNITAKRSVEIHSPGRVRGNINTPSLFVERGVFFDGNCQMDSSGAASDPVPSPRHSRKSNSGAQSGAQSGNTSTTGSST